MPRIYDPQVEITHETGVVPHHADRDYIKGPAGKKRYGSGENWKMIDVFLPWKNFVTEIKSCRHIVSSSLHGLVIAEAYGVSAEWETYSDKVIGEGFKFRDYFAGTGRSQSAGGLLPPIENLPVIQENLIKALSAYIESSEWEKRIRTFSVKGLLHRLTRS